MSLNGTNVGMGSDAFQEPIVDTGTTFFYLPTNVDSALISALNSSPSFMTLFPSTTLQDDPDGTGIGCTSPSSVTDAQVDAMLPPLVFSVPNNAGGADLSFSVPALESYLFDGGQGQFCLGIANGGPEDGATLGDQFMQAFVTVIDVGNNQVGLALDTGCSSASKRRSRDLSTFHPHLPRPRRRQ